MSRPTPFMPPCCVNCGEEWAAHRPNPALPDEAVCSEYAAVPARKAIMSDDIRFTGADITLLTKLVLLACPDRDTFLAADNLAGRIKAVASRPAPGTP